MAHKLETLLAAAERLRDDSSIRIRIVGEGAERERLESLARESRLTNVEFVGEVPRDVVASEILASHVCAVLLRATPTFLTVVPSKMLEIMAAGRPIVLGVAGEARALLEQAGAGMAIEPENVTELVSAIRFLQSNSARRAQCSENGRAFVRREFQRSSLATRYLEILESATRPILNTLPTASPRPETVAEPQ
jgi:glycosyltransferase involved in cell wall biosynthesis